MLSTVKVYPSSAPPAGAGPAADAGGAGGRPRPGAHPGRRRCGAHPWCARAAPLSGQPALAAAVLRCGSHGRPPVRDFLSIPLSNLITLYALDTRMVQGGGAGFAQLS